MTTGKAKVYVENSTEKGIQNGVQKKITKDTE
jgi:hypothetical protein